MLDESLGAQTIVPDPRFPEVAERIIAQAQSRLASGEWSNSASMEARAQQFERMRAEYKATGAITLDADTSPAIHSAISVLGNQFGTVRMPNRNMRDSFEVLRPLDTAILERRQQAGFHRQARRERGMER